MNISFRHVDGGMRAAQRDESLFRLKAPRDGMDCRIIPNVRCISEGDVPVLDAVLFVCQKIQGGCSSVRWSCYAGGTRRYGEQWAKDIADIAACHKDRIV